MIDMKKIVTFYVKDFRGAAVDDFIKYLQQFGMRVNLPHVNVCNKMLDTKGEVRIDIIFDEEKEDNGYQLLSKSENDAEWVDNKCSACGKGIENLIDSREWYENEKPNYCPFCGTRFIYNGRIIMKK